MTTRRSDLLALAERDGAFLRDAGARLIASANQSDAARLHYYSSSPITLHLNASAARKIAAALLALAEDTGDE